MPNQTKEEKLLLTKTINTSFMKKNSKKEKLKFPSNGIPKLKNHLCFGSLN